MKIERALDGSNLKILAFIRRFKRDKKLDTLAVEHKLVMLWSDVREILLLTL